PAGRARRRRARFGISTEAHRLGRFAGAEYRDASRNRPRRVPRRAPARTPNLEMRHLPLFALVRGRDCLIVGGGVVAERRARLLLEAGARPTLVAPEFAAGVEALAAAEPDVTLERAPFTDALVECFWLIVAATNDPDVNARVADAAERAHRFCNVVDDAARSSFIMPAIVDRDPVTIAISSGGLSPVVARHVKGLVESLVPSRIGALARLAGRWRRRVRAAVPNADEPP